MRTRHGPGAAKTARTVLSGVFGLAVRRGAVPTNPVRDIDRIKRPRRRNPARALMPAELTDLLAKVHADTRAQHLDLADVIEVMAGTGCRIGEALAIRRSRIVAGTVEINATIIRLKGQGLRIQERPKTAAGWRVIALPTHLNERLAYRCADGWVANDYDLVLPTVRGNIRDPRNTARDLRNLFDRIGYPWVHGHVFRKTVATRLDDAGLSARLIADQLGHWRPSMTQDTYLGRHVVSVAAGRVLDHGR